MSLATLKKKTQAKWKISGKNNGAQFVINKAGLQTTPMDSRLTGPGGGFSINGSHRNIGRVGQHMMMSKTPLVRHKSCCTSDNYVKPSVLSFKSMINL